MNVNSQKSKNNLSMKILKTLLLAIIGLLIIPEGIAQNAEKTLMTVGDENITVEEFWNIYQKNNTEKSIDKKSINEYLELYTNFRLKVNEAKALKKDTSAAFKKELNGYRDQLAKPYLVDEDINDKLMNEAYQRMQKDVRVSHILLFLDENALPEDTAKKYEEISKIREEIVSGKMTFADAAVKYSDDRSARDMPAEGRRPPRKGNKGDLGYFTVFDMVYPFEVAAYNTPLNEVTPPVRTRFGYHLIIKTDEIPAIGKAQVAHIFIKYMEGDTTTTAEAAEKKIDDIYDRLLAGETFEDLVKTMSDDKGSAVKGGELPWFGANRMVPTFIKQVSEFDSVGQISAPIHTSYGWHIIKYLDQKPIGSFESVKNEIKDRLKKDVRSEKGRQSKIAQVKKEEGFKEYPENLTSLAEKVDSTLLDHKYDLEKAKSFTEVLFTIGDEQFNLIDYIQNSGKKAAIKDAKVYVYMKYKEYADNMVIDFENRHLEEKYKEFALLINEYRDGILLFDLMDETVWSKAVKDTSGYENYFNTHRADYKWDKRVEASIFTISNSEVSDTLQKMVTAGLSDEEILKNIDNDSLKMVKYEVKKYSKGDNKEVDEMKWKAGTSQVFYNKSEQPIYLIRIHSKLKPMNKELEECRGMVISDYQNQLEKEWIAELKAKFPVTINQEVLKDLKKNGLTE
jgi:peptidyl-prolyl cis-trans isomerase SurA